MLARIMFRPGWETSSEMDCCVFLSISISHTVCDFKHSVLFERQHVIVQILNYFRTKWWNIILQEQFFGGGGGVGRRLSCIRLKVCYLAESWSKILVEWDTRMLPDTSRKLRSGYAKLHVKCILDGVWAKESCWLCCCQDLLNCSCSIFKSPEKIGVEVD